MFSKCIKVKRYYFPDPQKDQPVIYVFEVDVVLREDKITVVERRASQKEAFFNLNCEEETLVIWVCSKSVQVVDAVAYVYKEYEDFLTSKPILIHHVFEENEDLCKKICIQKLKALNKIIMNLSDSIPVRNLKEIVDGVAGMTLSQKNIRQLCNNVFFEHHDFNFMNPCFIDVDSYSSLFDRLKAQLLKEILEAISNSFVEEIRTRILANIDSKVKPHLKPYLLDLKVNIFPELFVMATFTTEHIDANSASWIKKIADEIYKTVCMNRTLIEGDILSNIETMCTETKKGLQAVSMQVNDLRLKIGFPDEDKVIQEWKKRQSFPKKQELMTKYPSVLNYIVGKKDGKSILKVFFEKKDDEAEMFLRDTCCFCADIEFDFIYVNEFKNDTMLPREPPQVDRHTKASLRKIIQDEEDKIVALYSTVVGIGVGRTMLSETEFGDPCIVLYCLDKTLVPFGEKKIPKSLKGYIVDIREDFFMFGLCMDCKQLDKGCCIGRDGEKSAGSVGFLVKSNCSSSKECGFLTAAHVAHGNVLELNKSATPVNGDFHNIVHPALSENVIGNVTKAFCGNRKTNEYQKGIDAAFVRFAEKKIRELPVLHIVNEDDVETGRRTFVSKKGISTNMTIGLLSQNTMSLEIKGIWFKNCFIIHNYEVPFFKEGDSGSGVFLSDADGKQKRALGIAFGLSKSKTQTCVCDIRDIVQTFDVDFYSEPQPMDTS